VTLGVEAVRAEHADRDRAKSVPINDIVLVEGIGSATATMPMACGANDDVPTIEIVVEMVARAASCSEPALPCGSQYLDLDTPSPGRR